MSYVRERWPNSGSRYMPLPPRVIAWDNTYHGPAGTPYIILEYAQGVPLIERWWQIEGQSAGAALQGILDLESCLLHEPFTQHGSLYFADDVSVRHCNDTPCRSGELTKRPELGKQLSARYRIGPTVNREWWRGEYARVEADRGPCKFLFLKCNQPQRSCSLSFTGKDMPTMITSAAEFQLRAIDVVDFASPHIRSEVGDIDLLRRLLYTCIRIAPLVMPHNSQLIKPALNHPDLTLSNLIVPQEGWAQLTCAIDWQNAAISPFIMASACLDVLPTSFIKLYFSSLKLSVGPADKRTIRNEGATSVSVKASRCVTPNVGAIVMKSFSLFLALSFTCKYVQHRRKMHQKRN